MPGGENHTTATPLASRYSRLNAGGCKCMACGPSKSLTVPGGPSHFFF
jgi:hypothetical protein